VSAAEQRHSIRGLPEWLIREYLAELGAAPDADPDAPRMAAGDWRATWTSQRVRIPGSTGLGLTQFDIVFTGDDAAVEDIGRRFMAKAQRGGG
jgi:hypothetical protein